MDTLRKVYVKGGEHVVAESPSELITILGSCVSVCLWDREEKRGGMNHYLLPKCTHSLGRSIGGVAATEMLIESMTRGLSSLKNLEAKIFGGGIRFFSNSFLEVGLQNVEVAKKILEDLQIPIVVNDTGGTNGRKIQFNTQTGQVAVSFITCWSNPVVSNHPELFMKAEHQFQ